MINNISYKNTNTIPLAYQSTNLSVAKSATSTISGSRLTVMDSISFSGTSVMAATYSDHVLAASRRHSNMDRVQDVVVHLLLQQGISTHIATDTGELDLTIMSPEEAASLVGPEGYLGIEQTSERIFQAALGLVGNDTARIDAIKAGVEQGFAQAKQAFGNWLPQIAYDTLDAVMKKLDTWVAASATVA